MNSENEVCLYNGILFSYKYIAINLAINETVAFTGKWIEMEKNVLTKPDRQIWGVLSHMQSLAANYQVFK